MKGQLAVYAIVLAWNQVEDTLECLRSLITTSYENFHIILVDNGSTDSTQEIIQDNFHNIKVLRLEWNVGIARGYNAGIDYALQHGADLVMVMNNDTIVASEMVSQLVRSISENTQVGVVMPKIFHYFGNRNRIWCAGARWRNFPPGVKQIGDNAEDQKEYLKRFSLEYAPSCCLLIKKETIETVGAFDPNYYFYFDDWDFSERVRNAGYQILFEPEAHIWHKVAISTRKTEKPARWWFAFGQSSVRFFLMHKSPFILFSHSAWFVIREIIKLKFTRIMPFIAGVVYGIALQKGWSQMPILSIPKANEYDKSSSRIPQS